MESGRKTVRLRVGCGLLVGIVLMATVAAAVYASGDRDPGKPDRLNEARVRATETWNRLKLEGRSKTHFARDLQWPFTSLRARLLPMPDYLERRAARTLGRPKDLDLRFKHSRYVQFHSAPAAMWIVRGPGVICIFRDKVMSAVCAPNAYADRHGLVLQVFQTAKNRPRELTRFLVFGLVPDGIGEAVLRVGRQPEEVRVRGNVFFKEARKPISVLPLGR
jgi:hypothetical protein